MPPPKIFQAFRRSSSRGAAAAAAHGMQPRPYDYGSVGRNSHLRPDNVQTYGLERTQSGYSARTPIDGDDDEYEDLHEYQDIRHSMVPTAVPSDYRSQSMAPSDADFRSHSMAHTSVAPSEFSDSRIPRVQRLDDPRSTMYSTIQEEEDETARTVSDGYVHVGRHSQDEYHHEPGPSEYHEAGSSRYHDAGSSQYYDTGTSRYPDPSSSRYHEAGSSQYTEHHPREPHRSRSTRRPAYQASEQPPPMRHGSSRRQTDQEPTVLDYRSQATSYIPSPAREHVPTYGPDTPLEPHGQPIPPPAPAYHIPPPGAYEYDRPPASTERSRGEYSQPPRSHAQYHSPSHTTQHMTSRDHVQPLIHTVSRRRHAETYYIIPSNRPVIFKDEHGKEITRVGDFSGRKRSRRKHPLIIQDEFGRELYRTGDMHDDHYGKSFGHDYQRHHERFDGSDHSSRTSAYSPGPPEDADSYGLPIKLIDQWGRPISPRVETVRRHGSQSSSSRSGRPSVPPNVILIDDFGNQIPIQVQPTRTDAGRYQSSAPQVYGQHPQMMSSRDAQTF